MHFVGERDACSTTTTVSQVAGNPESINTSIYSGFKEAYQIPLSNPWSITSIMKLTAFDVRVEH
ncbi:hypothetical protein XI03_07480 [Bradyrhizobium sp. CCBAU 65884]|nr:hypothetical protein [Bradyrhizobium sp. CCBAU 65884]